MKSTPRTLSGVMSDVVSDDMKGDVAAGSIFDFSLATEAARQLAQKK